MKDHLSFSAELPNPQYFPEAGAPPVPNFSVSYLDDGTEDAMHKIGDIISTDGEAHTISQKSNLVDYKNMVGKVTTVDKDSNGVTTLTADHALYSLYNAETSFPAYRVHNYDSWENFINHFIPASVGVFDTSGYSGNYIDYDPESKSYSKFLLRASVLGSSSDRISFEPDGIKLWGNLTNYTFTNYPLEFIGKSFNAGTYRVVINFTVSGGSATVMIGNGQKSVIGDYAVVTNIHSSTYNSGTHTAETSWTSSAFCPAINVDTSSSNVTVTLHSLTIYTMPENAPLVSNGIGKYGHPILYTRQAPRARHDNSFAVIGDKNVYLPVVARPSGTYTTEFIPSAVDDLTSLQYKAFDFTFTVSNIRRTLASDPAAITVRTAENAFIFRMGRHASDADKFILELFYKHDSESSGEYIINSAFTISDYIDAEQNAMTVTVRYDSVTGKWELYYLNTKDNKISTVMFFLSTTKQINMDSLFKVENIEHSGNTGKYSSLQMTGYTSSTQHTMFDYTAPGLFPKLNDTFFAGIPEEYPFYIPAQRGNLWQILNNINAILPFSPKVI